MARKIKLRNGEAARYPDKKDLRKIVQELSSDDLIGSTVISDASSEGDRIKYNLCRKILEFKTAKRLSQKDLAERMNLDEPEVSRILHYKIERYSIERLLAYARIIYPNLTLQVSAA